MDLRMASTGFNFTGRVPVDKDLTVRGMRIFWAATFLLIFFIVALGSWLAYREQRRAANRVVCFGDSLSACGGYGGRYSDYLAEALPECEVINRGKGGDTLEEGRKRFKSEVLDLNPRPKVVVLELGANDFLKAIRPIGALREDLEQLVCLAQDRGIGVVIAGVFGDCVDAQGEVRPKEYKEGNPEFGKQILEMERSIAKSHACMHIENIQADLHRERHWEDPRHPNAEGNKFVAQRILPALKKLLAERRAP